MKCGWNQIIISWIWILFMLSIEKYFEKYSNWESFIIFDHWNKWINLCRVWNQSKCFDWTNLINLQKQLAVPLPLTLLNQACNPVEVGSLDRPTLSSGCKIPHKPNLTQMVRHFNCDCNFFKMAISPRKIFLSFPIFNFLFFSFSQHNLSSAQKQKSETSHQ